MQKIKLIKIYLKDIYGNRLTLRDLDVLPYLWFVVYPRSHIDEHVYLMYNSVGGHNEWYYQGVDFKLMQELQKVLETTLCLLRKGE